MHLTSQKPTYESNHIISSNWSISLHIIICNIIHQAHVYSFLPQQFCCYANSDFLKKLYLYLKNIFLNSRDFWLENIDVLNLKFEQVVSLFLNFYTKKKTI